MNVYSVHAAPVVEHNMGFLEFSIHSNNAISIILTLYISEIKLFWFWFWLWTNLRAKYYIFQMMLSLSKLDVSEYDQPTLNSSKREGEGGRGAW